MEILKVIETQAKSGQMVEYRICEHLNKISVEVYVDGKRKLDGTPEPVNETVQGHYVYGKIKVVFMANESVWNDVWSAYTEAKESLESSDEYKLAQLRQQRESLVFDVKIAQDELYDNQTERIERAGLGESHRYDSDALEAKITEAKAALEVFDAEHPEITTLINKEREESLERNRWN